MKLSDFHYSLPEQLIAHYPTDKRSDSRLLSLNGATGQLNHGKFTDLLELLHGDDLLVFNNTEVIPARLYGKKESGGKIEILLERVLDGKHALAQIRASKSPKPGCRLLLSSAQEGVGKNEPVVVAEVLGRQGALFHLKFLGEEQVLATLGRIGHMPLPPYIKRSDEPLDWQRYQTVYASEKGAVAAPTAGLHYDDLMMQAISDKGIDSAFVTLHVGAGTFQPLRVDDIESHKMHAEYVQVSPEVCAKICACKQRGGRVVAVGTTSVRCLETASQAGVNEKGAISPYKGDTDIFIYPGYQFKLVDALITNFHLPESTLLMLVSAFAGIENIRHAYKKAVQEKYRFFSYGDAMFITHKCRI